MSLTLEIADRIASRTLAAGGEKGFLPLCVVVLDAGGCPLVLKRDERASIGRPEIARGKAAGCLSLGFGGRELQRRAQTMTAFMTAAKPPTMTNGARSRASRTPGSSRTRAIRKPERAHRVGR